MSESRKEQIRVEQEILDAKNKEIADDLHILQSVQDEVAEAKAQFEQAKAKYDVLFTKKCKLQNMIEKKQQIAKEHASEIYYLNHPRSRPKPRIYDPDAFF